MSRPDIEKIQTLGQIQHDFNKPPGVIILHFYNVIVSDTLSVT